MINFVLAQQSSYAFPWSLLPAQSKNSRHKKTRTDRPKSYAGSFVTIKKLLVMVYAVGHYRKGKKHFLFTLTITGARQQEKLILSTSNLSPVEISKSLKFINVPYGYLTTLTPSRAQILGLVRSFAGKCYASNAHIGKLTGGRKSRAVQVDIEWLKDQGLVSAEYRIDKKRQTKRLLTVTDKARELASMEGQLEDVPEVYRQDKVKQSYKQSLSWSYKASDSFDVAMLKTDYPPMQNTAPPPMQNFAHNNISSFKSSNKYSGVADAPKSDKNSFGHFVRLWTKAAEGDWPLNIKGGYKGQPIEYFGKEVQETLAVYLAHITPEQLLQAMRYMAELRIEQDSWRDPTADDTEYGIAWYLREPDLSEAIEKVVGAQGGSETESVETWEATPPQEGADALLTQEEEPEEVEAELGNPSLQESEAITEQYIESVFSEQNEEDEAQEPIAEEKPEQHESGVTETPVEAENVIKVVRLDSQPEKALKTNLNEPERVEDKNDNSSMSALNDLPESIRNSILARPEHERQAVYDRAMMMYNTAAKRPKLVAHRHCYQLAG